MGKALSIALAAGALAASASAADANLRMVLHCQESSAGKDCTEANGRSDAEWFVARKKIGFYVFGGPALPQEPLRILHEEYTKAGIEVWWTGDMIDLDRDRYYKGFNKRMEEAVDLRDGPGTIRKVYDRIDARINAAEVRNKGRTAGTGKP